MSSMPLVSICCLTFNHEKYIREALDGFVNQKTNFEFEVLIHDDASTDKTADIIREYLEKYPDQIKPIFQTENQWSKGIRPTQKFNFPRAKGKYIAMCEGDDYWIDPDKLQKQVDYLEQHPETSLTHHAVNIVDQSGGIMKTLRKEKNVMELEEVINSPINTCAVMFRNGLLDLPEEFYSAPNPDRFMFSTLAKHGSVANLGFVGACYRKTSTGYHSSQRLEQSTKAKITTMRLMEQSGEFAGQTKAIHKRVSFLKERAILKSLLKLRVGSAWRILNF